MRDDNDRLQDGDFDPDPLAGAVPMDKAKAVKGLDVLAPRVGKSLADAFSLFDRRASGEEKPIEFPEKWPGLKRELGGGLWPGLYVLTGTPGAGKSQFAIQLAVTAADAGTPVLYVALELSTAELVARICALKLEQNGGAWAAIYRGTDPGLLKKARELKPWLEQLPLRIEEGTPRRWSARHLDASIEALLGEMSGPTRPLIVVDYLQLVGETDLDARGGHEDLRERISNAAYEARAAVRKHNATALLLSSIARDKYQETLGKKGRDGERVPVTAKPASAMIGLGKESGDIEFAADGVFALCAEELDGAGSRTVHLAIAKQRAGLTSWESFSFDGVSFDWRPASAGPRAVDPTTQPKDPDEC